MGVLQGLGVVFGAAFVLLMLLFLRRTLIARSGAVEMSVRIYRRHRGRGWSLGLGQFAGDQFRWFRMFSLSPRPNRIFARTGLVVVDRRVPSDTETVALLNESVILECTDAGTPVELAMTTSTLTGFLSWVEAAAPGAGNPPYPAR